MNGQGTSAVTPAPGERYAFGPFNLDVSGRRLSRADQEIALPSRALDALVHLIRNRDRIVDKDEMIHAVWAGSFVSDDSVVHCVSVIRRALQDDSEHPTFIATLPRRGYKFVGDVANGHPTPSPALADANSTPAPVASDPVATPPPTRAWWTTRLAVGSLAGLAAAGLIAGTLAVARGSVAGSAAGAPHAPAVFGQAPAKGTSLASVGVLSPQGRALAFVARDDSTGASQLWVRALDSQAVRRIDGTNGATRPFWSPDGQRIAYFSDDKLRIATLAGRPVETVATLSVSPAGGTWNGHLILFGDLGTGLDLLNLDSGVVERVTSLEPSTDVAHAWPSFLPDGRHFIFTISSWNKDRAGVWLGSLDPTEPLRRVLTGISPAMYTDSGHLLYIDNDTLVAVPFDLGRGAVTGVPTPVARDVPIPRVAEGEAFSVAGDFLTFRAGARTEHLAWFTRQGERLGTVRSPTAMRNPMISPDGNLLLATGTPARAPGLWLIDLRANAATRLGADGIGPLWSPDGQRIAFATNGGLDLYTSSTVGQTNNQLLLHDTQRKVLQAWSPDGRFIVFAQRSPETALDLWLLPIADPGHPRPLLASNASERGAAISPDGRWLAYCSDESGSSEVYIQEFPGLGSKRVVSVGGGADPSWRRDGKELYYVAPARSLMSVKVTLGDAPVIARPQMLFRSPMIGEASEARNHYVVSPDGKSFLINISEDGNDRETITVMVNWKGRLATPGV